MALRPPPPPADRVNGGGESASFHGPVAAIVLSALSVRFVPPTARTHGEVAGQDVAGCSSDEVSCGTGTPRAHADEPESPAATTTVIPSAASAASTRLASVRDAVYGLMVDSHSP